MELTIAIGGGFISVHKKTKTGIVPTTINAEFTNLKEGRYLLEMKKILPTRTPQQNKYLWACYGLIAVEVGYIIEEMDKQTKKEIVNAIHETFKRRFLSGKTIRSTKDGRKRLKIEGSTKDLDTNTFGTEYLDKIRALHPYLPDPKDDHLLEFIDRYYFL